MASWSKSRGFEFYKHPTAANENGSGESMELIKRMTTLAKQVLGLCLTRPDWTNAVLRCTLLCHPQSPDNAEGYKRRYEHVSH